MSNPTCQTCRFWVQKPKSALGLCHRFPDFRQTGELYASDWCGEHEPIAPAPQSAQIDGDAVP